jgi:hypothetical protein
MCEKKCHEDGCPFAFTEESEKIQNYGCLPEPYDIVAMRVFHNKTWACHSDNSKPCTGSLNFMREHGIDCRIIDRELVTEKSVTKEMVTLTDQQHASIREMLRVQPTKHLDVSDRL